MSESANVRAIEALDELRGALVQFRAEAEESLQAAAQEISRTFDWLAERKQHWQNEVRRREEWVREAQRELARCEASGYRDKDGRYHQPDCSAQQFALLQARVRLREAEAELETVRGWINLLQQVVESYQQTARRLNACLADDVTKAMALLGSSADKLRTYASMSAQGSGLAMGTSGSPSSAVAADETSLTWSVKVVPREANGVDVYITPAGKDPDTYPHIHGFYPDKRAKGQVAVLSWSRNSHSTLSELAMISGGLPQYILGLLANLPDETTPSFDFPFPSTPSESPPQEPVGPATPVERREGSASGPERRG